MFNRSRTSKGDLESSTNLCDFPVEEDAKGQKQDLTTDYPTTSWRRAGPVRCFRWLCHRVYLCMRNCSDSVNFRNQHYTTVGSNNVPLLDARVPKSRGCCWYLVRLLVIALLAVFTLLTVCALYSRILTRDPCVVDLEQKTFIAKNVMMDDRLDSNGKHFTGTTPKIIHQQWKNDLGIPDKYKPWSEKWKEFFPEPEFKHMFWTDETALELIKNHYAWFLPVYEGYEYEIQRADAARYFILDQYGGIYADLDYEPMVNFWDLIPKTRVGLVESPYQYNEYVQNSLMSSPKGDPLWRGVFEELIRKRAAPILQSTGPMLLDSVLVNMKEDWMYLPCEIFHRIPLGELQNSPYATLFHREVLGRFFPMKSCGNFNDNMCQVGKHHNTASYLADVGLVKLLWS